MKFPRVSVSRRTRSRRLHTTCTSGSTRTSGRDSSTWRTPPPCLRRGVHHAAQGAPTPAAAGESPSQRRQDALRRRSDDAVLQGCSAVRLAAVRQRTAAASARPCGACTRMASACAKCTRPCPLAATGRVTLGLGRRLVLRFGLLPLLPAPTPTRGFPGCSSQTRAGTPHSAAPHGGAPRSACASRSCLRHILTVLTVLTEHP